MQLPGFVWASSPLLGLAIALSPAVVCAQATDLPSVPSPNPSSLRNSFYGSVTAQPATNEVLKLSLDDAVARGLKTNLGLKDAEQSEKGLHGQELEALQYFLPTITLSGGPSAHEYDLAAFGFNPSVLGKIGKLFPGGLPASISFITRADVVSGQFNYDQTLLSGPVFSGYKAARQAEKVAYFAKMSARGEVVQQVATAYLAVIADQGDVENAKALLKSDKVLWDQARDKHQAGTAANLDELRARVQFQQQEQALEASLNKQRKAEILLKREIGIAPGQPIELTDPAPYSELASRTVEDLRAEAYANRQDYQNLQAQQLEEHSILEARRQERLPTLSFKGNYGVTDVTGIGAHGTFAAMGTLKVPVFREATLRGDADVAKAQARAASLQLDDLRSKIDQQVQSSLLDVQAAHQLVEVAKSNVDLATRAFSDESDRFSAGVDDNLPLVQAQASLAAAQSNLVETLYQYNVSKLALARNTGVLELQYKKYLGN